jgi:hypothetical protein
MRQLLLEERPSRRGINEFWMELAESCSSMIPDFFVIDNDTGSKTSRSKKISSVAANAATSPKDVLP